MLQQPKRLQYGSISELQWEVNSQWSAVREIHVHKRIPSVKSQVRIKVKIKEFINRGLSSKDIHKHYDIQ